MIIITIEDMHNPAIDKPFGFLNTPTKENISPKSQRITFATGTQQNTRPISANTKPAVPILLLGFVSAC